jgi:hypothetical protein
MCENASSCSSPQGAVRRFGSDETFAARARLAGFPNAFLRTRRSAILVEVGALPLPGWPFETGFGNLPSGRMTRASPEGILYTHGPARAIATADLPMRGQGIASSARRFRKRRMALENTKPDLRMRRSGLGPGLAWFARTLPRI